MDILDIALAAKRVFRSALKKNWGANNFGKILAVGENGDVTAVNGAGAEVLTAGDVLYSGSTAYEDGTVGKVLKETSTDTTQLKSAVGVVESAVNTTPEQYTVNNYYYIAAGLLKPGTTYKIGISVATSGVYGVKTSTATNACSIVGELFAVSSQFTANVMQYVYYTPSVEGEKYLRLTVNNVSWTASISEVIKSEELLNEIIGENNYYGNNGATSTTYTQNFDSFLVTPCKKTTKGGQVTSLYVKCYSAGTTKLYVGAVDQLYRFIPREEYDINVSSGEQNVDVSALGIYVDKDEQVAFRFIGQTPFVKATGTPECDNSFYYAVASTMQMQVYGAAYAAVFGFGYNVSTSDTTEARAAIDANTQDINILKDEVSFLQSNFNVVSDRQGNKYRMIVQNNAIELLSMNFHHVLCVGNSYTIHPTTDDTASDYRNSIWWGHWAMAASAESVAWPSMLQNALRQKVNDAVVTPVFGRRYETNPTTYTLSNSNTFTYWTGSAWASLKDNIASFSDVDAVVFFLGANYSGNDWYTLYGDMVEQFYTWFPNATMFCCSCAAWSMQDKDDAIQQVASEQFAAYISMVGINGKSKVGSYVYGDDNSLHQIANSAVANHFGDYGEYLINERICAAMGYSNNTALYTITLSSPSGVSLSVASNKTVSGAVVSVFADVASGTTLSSITVKDANNNGVSVTDHGATDYGRIFTFIMPSSDVTITGTTA